MRPETQAVMDLMDASFPRPENGGLTPAEARQKLDDDIAALGIEPIPLASVEDRTVPGPAGDVPVRVYRPRDDEASAGVVYFHGGGWTICSLDTHDGSCRLLATEADVVVVQVDYRLAPEHKFPAAAEDAFAATAYVAEHADEFGIDPARLAVAGDSAGGNLAAAVAQMARDREGPELAFQFLVYPVIDGTREHPSFTENGEGYFLTAQQMRWYWDQYTDRPEDRTNPYASPIVAEDLSGLPPALVVTAEFDPLRDEGEAYAGALEDAGVPAAVHRAPGMFHGFFALRKVLDEAGEANDLAFEAVRKALA